MLPFDDLRLGDGVRIDAIIAPEQTAQNAIKNGYPVKILRANMPSVNRSWSSRKRTIRNGPPRLAKSSSR